METTYFKTKIAEIGVDILNLIGQAWWIEISTLQPQCIYYFGPFITKNEANMLMPEYIEDLENESAQGIQTDVKRRKPTLLTIDDNLVFQVN
jgi:Domain of unknown function (DUF1816)